MPISSHKPLRWRALKFNNVAMNWSARLRLMLTKKRDCVELKSRTVQARTTRPKIDFADAGVIPRWRNRLPATRHFTWLALAAGLIAIGPATPVIAKTPQGQPTLPTVKIQAGIHIIRAEVANTFGSRQMGLMHRQSLPRNGGMIFVFEIPEAHCFWMKNTPLPLSIAFIADDGRVVNIADMKPFDENSHCAKEEVRFALEMEQGWFERKGIKAGSRLKSKQLFSPR